MKTHLILSTLLLTAAAHAGSSSADYAITTDTLDFGGQKVSSVHYAIQGSVTSVTGVSDNTSPVTTVARHGYIGQLYELTGYGLLASDYQPPEAGSTQIIPVRTADDGTILVIPATGFTFAPVQGAITGISAGGLVETSAVYEDTTSIVGATSPLFAGQIQVSFEVQDTLPDNYGTYAADDLPDSWQNQYFGLDSPLAAPLLDPDGDGQNNRFEYIAGIIPNNPLSRFLLRIEPVPGEPNHKELKFSPVFPDRSYVVKSNTTLNGSWQNLTDFTDDNQQPERSVTDRAADVPSKFYKVEISKP